MAAAVRFCHFALFEEPLLSLPSYVVDFAIAFAAASLGYRLVRARQMAVQYGWLYRRTRPARLACGWARFLSIAASLHRTLAAAIHRDFAMLSLDHPARDGRQRPFSVVLP